MSQKSNVFHSLLQKQGGKLIHLSTIKDKSYKDFLKNLEEGQIVDIFMDANVDSATLAQLAKVHKCIRELASYIGYSFEDMKLEVKRAAGLCIKKDLGGEMFMVCKSFSKCSKEELGLAIEALIQMGDFNGINFR